MATVDQRVTQLTRILGAIAEGNCDSDKQLLPLVYGELRRLAAVKLANEKAGPDLASHSFGSRSLHASDRR